MAPPNSKEWLLQNDIAFATCISVHNMHAAVVISGKGAKKSAARGRHTETLKLPFAGSETETGNPASSWHSEGCKDLCMLNN